MKPIQAYALTLVLTMGTILGHAATLSADERALDGNRQAGMKDQAAVNEGSKVTIAFTITVPETREVIPHNVSEYAPGQHQLIPALEGALMGMKQGEHKRVDLQPEEAFGPYDEQKLVGIRREMLPPTVRKGMIYETSEGRFTVVALTQEAAVIDFNHPLAGKHVVFDIEILRVEHGS